MIPTAQVLCDILNDPAIPSQAKPWVWSDISRADIQSDTDPPEVLWIVPGVSHSPFVDDPVPVNAALFWSLSAWFCERTGDMPKLNRYSDGSFGGGHGVFPSPVEALAAVVRQVAATPPAR